MKSFSKLCIPIGLETLCYMLAGLVMVLAGKRIYRNYQVLNR